MFKLIPFLTVLINCLKKGQIQQVLLLVPSSGLHNQECHISSQRARPCGQKIKRHTCGNESFDSTWCQELLSNSPLPKTSAATRNQWNCSSPSFSTVHTLCRSCLNFTNGRHAVNISKLRPRNRKSKNGKTTCSEKWVNALHSSHSFFSRTTAMGNPSLAAAAAQVIALHPAPGKTSFQKAPTSKSFCTYFWHPEGQSITAKNGFSQKQEASTFQSLSGHVETFNRIPKFHRWRQAWQMNCLKVPEG
jgi:hypothetical protein